MQYLQESYRRAVSGIQEFGTGGAGEYIFLMSKIDGAHAMAVQSFYSPFQEKPEAPASCG